MAVKGEGVRRYFYEYLVHQAMEAAREQNGDLIPISQARAIRGRIDELLVEQGVERGMDEPTLQITPVTTAIDTALSETVPGLDPLFGDTPSEDGFYKSVEDDFRTMVQASQAQLPISPYDPRWADRASVRSLGRHAGVVLAEEMPEDGVANLHGIRGTARTRLYGRDEQTGALSEVGPVRTMEDMTGLTALARYMSKAEYDIARGWVVGDTRRGDARVEAGGFASPVAVERCKAVLAELQAQGVDYKVMPDRVPGQLKVRAGSMEIRLLDPVNEDYAGARIYDNGVEVRYSTDARDGDAFVTPSVSPAQAVDLLRFAQGQKIMRTDRPGVAVGTPGTTRPVPGRRGATVQVQEAYVSGRGGSFVVGDYTGPGARSGNKLMILRKADNMSQAMFFALNETGAENAERFGAEAVESARVGFIAALATDELVEHARTQVAKHGADTAAMVPPPYSPDAEVAAIQRGYWEVLTGVRKHLLRPGVSERQYNERVARIEAGELEPGDFGNLVYSGEPEQVVAEHAEDLAYDLVGTWEPTEREIDGEWVTRRFNPGRVSRYMNSEHGPWTNLDNLAAACRRLEVDSAQMLGEDFHTQRFQDRLIRFDATTARSMTDPSVSDFMRGVGQSISDTVAISGGRCDLENIAVDDNGVIQWKALRAARNGEATQVTGIIGQVFDRGEYGEIITKFASGENRMIVPGYEARIVAQDPSAPRASVEERTRLRGYEQLITERVQAQVSRDMCAGRTEVGEGSTLNGVYSRVQGIRRDVDWMIPRGGEYGLNETDRAILATEAKRVRYSNEVRAGSTMHAAYAAEAFESDPVDDNHFDAWQLTGGRNMVVLDGRDAAGMRAPAGYFDPFMTGTALNQGIVRYLTADAVVDTTGAIVPGDGESLTGTRAPLMCLEGMDVMQHDIFNRQQMGAAAVMQSNQMTQPEGTALMPFGGWGTDDGIVISKEFAERYRIAGSDGQRPLVVGDKISDRHGNKGVVSLIVDRHMDPEAAAEQDLTKEVAVFANNPDLDVVISPFSTIGRDNAGVAVEMRRGRSFEQTMSLDIQERVEQLMAQDEQTDLDWARRTAHADYLRGLSLDDYLVGLPDKAENYDTWWATEQSRHAASGQGQSYEDWVRSSTGVMPLYGTQGQMLRNDGLGHMSFAITHMAVDEKTHAYTEEDLKAGKGRRASGQLVWSAQSHGCDKLVDSWFAGNATPEADLRERLAVVGLQMGADSTLAKVGDEVLEGAPERQLFQMPELVRTPPRSAGGLPGLNHKLMRREFGELISDKGGDMEIPFPLNFPHPHGGQLAQTESGTWRLPVMSSHLRSGQEFEDGSTTTHDYTHHYQDVFTEVCTWRHAEALLAENDNLSGAQREGLKATMAKAERTAQRHFDSITRDVVSKRIESKHNDFKESIMSVHLPDSATMVWTADPRLKLSQVAMNAETMAQMGVREGEGMAVWRDPQLHDAGLKWMGVQTDDRLVGLSVHPAMAAIFDGDFDGDAVGLARVRDREAAGQAAQKMAVAAHLVDTSVVEADGLHPLVINTGLDTKLAMHMAGHDFGLAEIRKDANELESRRDELSDEDFLAAGEQILERMDEFYAATGRQCFDAALGFGSDESYLQSMREVCVESGAKGSEAKLADQARGLGDGNGTLLGRDEQEGSMFATAMKAHDTGLGGKYSHRAVAALRDVDLKPVLELTYPVTQSIMQAKKDAAEAGHKDSVLRGVGRDLWRGHLLELGDDGWKAVRAEDGSKVQATAEQALGQFVEFYSGKDGFNVPINPAYAEKVVAALTDPQTGLMRNLEEDKTLQGSVLDRVAYASKDGFALLCQAAQDKERLFSGLTEQFACVDTRAAMRRADLIAEVYEAEGAKGLERIEVLVGPEAPRAAVKADVLAAGTEGAKARGDRRRSNLVVGAGGPGEGVRAHVSAEEQDGPVEDVQETSAEKEESQVENTEGHAKSTLTAEEASAADRPDFSRSGPQFDRVPTQPLPDKAPAQPSFVLNQELFTPAAEKPAQPQTPAPVLVQAQPTQSRQPAAPTARVTEQPNFGATPVQAKEQSATPESQQAAVTERPDFGRPNFGAAAPQQSKQDQRQGRSWQSAPRRTSSAPRPNFGAGFTPASGSSVSKSRQNDRQIGE